jgi:ABC-type nitrate/sulfonate/bicarbonate transport system permease component
MFFVFSGFMLQRLIRLYPIYLAGLLLGLCIHALTWIDEKTDPALIAAEVVPQLVMMPSLHFGAGSIFTLHPPA